MRAVHDIEPTRRVSIKPTPAALYVHKRRCAPPLPSASSCGGTSASLSVRLAPSASLTPLLSSAAAVISCWALLLARI